MDFVKLHGGIGEFTEEPVESFGKQMKISGVLKNIRYGYDSLISRTYRALGSLYGCKFRSNIDSAQAHDCITSASIPPIGDSSRHWQTILQFRASALG